MSTLLPDKMGDWTMIDSVLFYSCPSSLQRDKAAPDEDKVPREDTARPFGTLTK